MTPAAGATRRWIQLLSTLLRPHRRLVAIVVVAMLVETAAGLAAPWPLKLVVDSVLGSHPLPSWAVPLRDLVPTGSGASVTLVAAALTVAIAVLGGVASYVDTYGTESVSQWVAHDLRGRLYDHLHRLALSYYDTHQTAHLLSTLTDDVAAIQAFASSVVLGVVVDVLTIAGMLGIMLWLDWDFALVALAVAPIALATVARVRQAVREATREVRRSQGDMLAVMQQGLGAIREVEAYGRQDLEEARLEAASRATVAAALAARRMKSLVGPVLGVLVALVTAVVLWRGTALVLAGTMTLGALTVFLAYLARFFKPVQDLAKQSGAIAQTAVALERVVAVLETDEMIPVAPIPRVPATVRGGLTFEHVGFAYAGGMPVLRDVHVAIAAGRRIGIVGSTGSGKSTLVNLVPRFYDPTAGRVLLDGVDLRELDLQALRGRIGFVLQDTALFRGTIRENIAYGRAGATEREIRAAAAAANVDEFVARLPLGLDTPVGERGARLSGGQRQRIGIARALVRDAPILILDEPTAALDAAAERLVVEALERLMRGRTSITIAHRLSTIRDSDEILVLEAGRLVERGAHAELLRQGGRYARLHEAQAGGLALAGR